MGHNFFNFFLKVRWCKWDIFFFNLSDFFYIKNFFFSNSYLIFFFKFFTFCILCYTSTVLLIYTSK